MSKLIDSVVVFKNYIRILTVTGQNPPLRNSRWYYAYKWFALFQKTMVFLLWVSFFLQCLFAKSMQEMFEYVFILFAVLKCVVSHGFKTKHTLNDLPKLCNLLRKLDHHVQTQAEANVLRNSIKSAKNCFLFFLILFLIILVLADVIIFLSPKPILVFQPCLPWDWEGGSKFKFHCAHVYVSYSAYLIAALELYCDSFPQACMSILSGHLHALSVRIENIKERKLDQQHMADYELTTCIKDHIIILEAFSMVQNFLSLPAMMQLMNSAFAQCTLAFYIVNGGGNMQTMFIFIMVFFALTFMSFFPCYYGQVLLQANENLTHSIYACNWPQQNVKFRKCLLQFLRQSQCSNLQIKAANLFPLNLKTFLMLMKTNYSIIAMLDQISQE